MNLRSIHLSRATLVFAVTLLMASCNLAPQKNAIQKNESLKSPPVLLPAALGEELRNGVEKTEDRSDWFTFQRTYPRDFIPSNARRAAWASRPRKSDERELTLAAEQRWQPIGPSPTISYYVSNWGHTSGRVNAVAVSPSNSQVVLIGSSTGGIWRSANGGASFDPVSDDQIDLAVGSIAFAKSNPNIAYAGMGDTKLGYLGSGVLKTTNAGRSWARVSNNTLPAPGTVGKIEVDPTDANRVYVAQFSRLSGEKIGSSGFYLSTDGGGNWTRTIAGWARDFVIDPNNRRTIYLGIASRADQTESAAPGLYRSTDSGNTWTSIYQSPYDATRTRDMKVSVSSGNPKSIYVYTGGFAEGSFDVRVVVSTDGGASWTNRNAAEIDPAQFAYNTFISADPATADTVFAGSRDLYKSTDGGASWINLTRNFAFSAGSFAYTPQAANTHADQHALAFSPSNPKVIYLGNDGGVSKSTDGGNSFQSLNATLTLSQFVSIAIHPTDPTISYAGSQDNGAQRRVAGSGQWQEFVTGDGGNLVINPQAPGMVFSTYPRGNVYRFYNDGSYYDRQVASNGTFGEPEVNGRLAFYPPFTGNGVDGTLYFGTWRLFVSSDLGETWTAPAGEADLTRGITEVGQDVLSAIGVGPSNTKTIYTGSAQGRAMVSMDGGITWNDSMSGLPDRSITSINVDRNDSAVAYLTVSGFGSGHVFKTTNAGAEWVDITGNLPDIPTNALLIDPLNPNVLYAGTDLGVFRSTSGGTRWEDFNNGMPPVIVEAFAAQQSGLIQAATYGRGVYQFTTTSAGTSLPSINSVSYNGKKQVIIQGERFGDLLKVFINSQDVSGFIQSASETTIKLKGKMKKLGLRAGDNSVMVDSNGAASNTFTLIVP